MFRHREQMIKIIALVVVVGLVLTMLATVVAVLSS
jgi:hypothetical protein